VLAEGLGAKVIHQPKRGYGLALLTGFRAATGDIIATVDGDGTYPVEMIPFMAWRLEHQKVDFISGCRFPLLLKKSMSLRNQIGNTALTILASVLFLRNFRDVLSGMWVFRRSSLSGMDLRSEKWDLSQEIKIEACRSCRFEEIHITYSERVGESKLFPWRVGFENLVYFFIHRLGLRGLFFKRYEF
jgi:glycosyltransferase involved in cell wall biosynthesis